MADDRSPAEIEREIEAERAGLARSLEELQAQFSPETMVNTATTYMRDHGGEVAANVGRQVKENPVAAALTGIGLVWLMVGSSRSPEPRRRALPPPSAGEFRSAYATDEPALAYDERRHPSAPGRLSDPMEGFDSRVARASGDADADSGPSAYERASDKAGEIASGARQGASSAAHSVREGIDTGGERAKHGYARASGGVASAAGSTREGLASTGRGASRRWEDARDGTSRAFAEWQGNARDGYAKARGRAKSAKGRAYARSAELRARLAEGTESMSEAARLRVMRARQAAYEAQRGMEERFGEYASSGQRAYEQQPLLAGLIAAGIGAAIAAALPRTEREDEMFGAYRDQAFDEADRVFHEEAAKLRAVAEAAAGEARTMADEAVTEVKDTLGAAKEKTPTGKEAVNKAEGAATSAAGRIAEAARSEAEKQDLGGSVKS